MAVDIMPKHADTAGDQVVPQPVELREATSDPEPVVETIGQHELDALVDHGHLTDNLKERLRAQGIVDLLQKAQGHIGAPIRAHASDLGNCQRLVARHGDDIRFVRAWGRWLVYRRGVWLPDEDGEIDRLAKATVRGIYREAANTDDDGVRAALAAHARASESASRLKAMVELAKTERGVAAVPSQFDTNPWLLTAGNGTIDLRTGKLGPHRRADLITKLAPVTYKPEATCPTWEAFLATIFDGDRELIEFIQRAVGYTLTGSISEQVLFFLHGTGANGKSTFLETLRALLGDYARQAEFSSFLERQGDAVRNDLARLCGARLVAAVEVESGRRLSEAVVKSVTGGDTITARYLFQEYFEFVPAFKLWLAGNHKPVIRNTDHGIWRRIRLIPFTVTIPKEQQDRELAAKLRAELPGILAWAVRGCLAWQREGLGEPAAVRAATDEYRAESDIVGQFLAECCELDPAARVSPSSLYAAYSRWAERAGERPLRQVLFGQRLTERGLESSKSNGARYWKGLRLANTGQPAPGEFAF